MSVPENGFNLQNFVARVHKVVDSTNDRKAGTNVCLKAELHTTGESCVLEKLVVLIVRRCCYLVASDDADVVLKQWKVDVCHFFRSSTIHEHAVEDVHLQNLVAK